MFTYVGFFRLAPLAREHPEKTPEYFEKVHKIVGLEGGTLERFMATMGPWEYLAIFKFPDNEVAFRILDEIAKLEIFETPQRTSRPSSRSSPRGHGVRRRGTTALMHGPRSVPVEISSASRRTTLPSGN
jgi:uncharacterized protein with GYD domain